MDKIQDLKGAMEANDEKLKQAEKRMRSRVTELEDQYRTLRNMTRTHFVHLKKVIEAEDCPVALKELAKAEHEMKLKALINA
jgi:DNA repair exonuclease SbcCD ATPase subunit